MPIPAAEERRRRVLAYAEELFVRRGFAGATVDDLAHRAGEARSTIFKQLGRKIDLLLLVAEEADHRAADAVHEARLDERRIARRRARGEPRPPTPMMRPPLPHEAAADRTARFALLRNRETALLAPALLEARAAGEQSAGDVLVRWSAVRRAEAAGALRSADRFPRPDLVEATAELAGPWPYLGLVVEGAWTAAAYTQWLRRLVLASISPYGAVA